MFHNRILTALNKNWSTYNCYNRVFFCYLLVTKNLVSKILVTYAQAYFISTHAIRQFWELLNQCWELKLRNVYLSIKL